MLRLLACMLFCGCLALGLATDASAAPRVVLVSLEKADALHWPEAERRLRDELLAAGFEIVPTSVQPDVEGTAVLLERISRTYDADGAVRVVRTSTGADAQTWMFNPRTQETTYRALRQAPPLDNDAAQLMALRLVEVLHGGLLRVRPAQALPKSASPQAQRSGPSHALGAGVSAAAAPGGLGVLWGPSLGASASLARGLSIELEAFGSLPLSDVAREQGSADIGLGFARLNVAVDLLRRESFALGLSLGGGPALVWSTGTESDQLQLRREHAWTSIASAGLYLNYELSSGWRLRARSVGGIVQPGARIAFGDTVVARTSPPFVDVLLGVEWLWAR